MTNMINARPRFGLEGNTIFDYQTSRYTPISEGFLTTPEGRWDLLALADCLRRGAFIETAMVPRDTKGHSDEVLEANRQFMEGPLDPVTGLPNTEGTRTAMDPAPRDDRNMTAAQIAAGGQQAGQYPGPGFDKDPNAPEQAKTLSGPQGRGPTTAPLRTAPLGTRSPAPLTPAQQAERAKATQAATDQAALDAAKPRQPLTGAQIAANRKERADRAAADAKARADRQANLQRTGGTASKSTDPFKG